MGWNSLNEEYFLDSGFSINCIFGFSISDLISHFPDRVVKWIAKNCEIAIAIKIAISQLTQFIFLSAGRNRNITQFDFLEGRNCEIAKNCEIGEKTIFVSRIQPILEFF